MSKLTPKELQSAKDHAWKRNRRGAKGGWIVNKRGERVTFGWENYYWEYVLHDKQTENPIAATTNTSKTNAETEIPSELTTILAGKTGKWIIGNACDEAIVLLQRTEDLYWTMQRDFDADLAKESFTQLTRDIHLFLRAQ